MLKQWGAVSDRNNGMARWGKIKMQRSGTARPKVLVVKWSSMFMILVVEQDATTNNKKPTVTECIYRVAWLIQKFDLPQMFEAFAGSVSLVLALAIK